MKFSRPGYRERFCGICGIRIFSNQLCNSCVLKAWEKIRSSIDKFALAIFDAFDAKDKLPDAFADLSNAMQELLIDDVIYLSFQG